MREMMRGIKRGVAWLARAMPLKAAASKLEPSSQSPHMPALPCGSKMQGISGVLVGRAAPLHSLANMAYKINQHLKDVEKISFLLELRSDFFSTSMSNLLLYSWNM